MADLFLVKATPDNHLMNQVITDWDKQLAAHKIPKSALDAVRTYEAQLKPDKSYGVFVLCEPTGDGGGRAPFEAFVHINHAFPNSIKPTLRLTWNRLAPRYEQVADSATEHARVFSLIASNALFLARGAFKSSEIKIYLHSHADRVHGKAFAANLTAVELPFNVRVRSSWLHFEMLQ